MATNAVNNTADLMALITKNGAQGIDAATLEAAVKQLATQTTDTGGEKTTKRRRKMHDPNAPKKPKTAYMLWQWSDSGVPMIKSKNADLSHTEAVKMAAQQWRDMNDDAKQPFVNEANKLHDAWVKEKAEYQAANPEPELVEKTTGKRTGGSKKTGSTSKAKFVPGDAPSAPPGMTGPHEGYLAKVCKDSDGKRISAFSSFEEAVAEAFKLGDKCGGITRTRLGYSLRVGPSICIDDASRNKKELSWLISSDGAEQPTNVYDAETDDDESEAAQSEHEPEPEPEPKDDGAGSKSDNDDNDDSDEEEGEDYPEWEYNGVTYYYDESDNSVMNDDGEVIGTRMQPNKKHSDYWIKFN